MRRALLALALALTLTFPAAPVAHGAPPVIVAHRGGPVGMLEPSLSEESTDAFAESWSDYHAALEADVRLTSDRVPVLLHDPTLDRTTACFGPVDALTWRAVRTGCPTDVLGSGRHPRHTGRTVPITSLRDLLRYARRTGALLQLDLKNLPGQPGFDPTDAYATTVAGGIRASGVAPPRITLTSFWAPNLDAVRVRVPGVRTCLLTDGDTGAIASVAFAASRHDNAWGPRWPVPAGALARAHQRGLKVEPWTLDTVEEIRAAAAAGADAVTTDDPERAADALDLPSGGLAAITLRL